MAIICLSCIAKAKNISGKIALFQQPIAGATVSLWETSWGGSAKKVTEVTSNTQGVFSLDLPRDKASVFSLVSQGGAIQGNVLDKLSLLTIVDSNVQDNVVINELTTIGSVWPNAQLLNKARLNGSTTALAIGSGHVHHLVNVATGNYGETILNGSNLPNSETLSRMNTLAS